MGMIRIKYGIRYSKGWKSFQKEEDIYSTQCTNILPDVAPQNIITMFNAVKEFNNRQ